MATDIEDAAEPTKEDLAALEGEGDDEDLDDVDGAVASGEDEG